MKIVSYLKKRKQFNKIIRDIKSIKIQGAKAVAKKALYAYFLFPSERTKKRLLSLRPTEPLLRRVLAKAKYLSYKKIISHFSFSQNKINKYAFRLIKNKDVIFTHCHSSTVVEALIYAKKNKKYFEVYNTETRPLFQGRKTLRELNKAGIKVTSFVDSAMQVALKKEQGTKKVNKIFLGADAILKEGALNKIGSGVITQLAQDNKIPVYILADSWKYSSKPIQIEERNPREVWKKLFRKSKIENPAFELIPKKQIKAIVSEIGILTYDEFLKKVKKV